jgi:hypothetical protein
MVDMASISAAITGLKAATDIARGIVDLKTATEIQGKVIELQGVILAAQSSALAAQSDQFTLLEQVRELKEKMAHLEAWSTEKQRYKMQQWGHGSFVYLLKEEEAAGEPSHALCTTCYERGVKSVLQSNGEPQWTKHAWDCPSCKASVKASSRALENPEERTI